MSYLFQHSQVVFRVVFVLEAMSHLGGGYRRVVGGGGVAVVEVMAGGLALGIVGGAAGREDGTRRGRRRGVAAARAGPAGGARVWRRVECLAKHFGGFAVREGKHVSQGGRAGARHGRGRRGGDLGWEGGVGVGGVGGGGGGGCWRVLRSARLVVNAVHMVCATGDIHLRLAIRSHGGNAVVAVGVVVVVVVGVVVVQRERRRQRWWLPKLERGGSGGGSGGVLMRDRRQVRKRSCYRWRATVSHGGASSFHGHEIHRAVRPWRRGGAAWRR